MKRPPQFFFSNASTAAPEPLQRSLLVTLHNPPVRLAPPTNSCLRHRLRRGQWVFGMAESSPRDPQSCVIAKGKEGSRSLKLLIGKFKKKTGGWAGGGGGKMEGNRPASRLFRAHHPTADVENASGPGDPAKCMSIRAQRRSRLRIRAYYSRREKSLSSLLLILLTSRSSLLVSRFCKLQFWLHLDIFAAV